MEGGEGEGVTDTICIIQQNLYVYFEKKVLENKE